MTVQESWCPVHRKWHDGIEDGWKEEPFVCKRVPSICHCEEQPSLAASAFQMFPFEIFNPKHLLLDETVGKPRNFGRDYTS